MFQYSHACFKIINTCTLLQITTNQIWIIHTDTNSTHYGKMSQLNKIQKVVLLDAIRTACHINNPNVIRTTNMGKTASKKL